MANAGYLHEIFFFIISLANYANLVIHVNSKSADIFFIYNNNSLL